MADYKAEQQTYERLRLEYDEVVRSEIAQGRSWADYDKDALLRMVQIVTEQISACKREYEGRWKEVGARGESDGGHLQAIESVLQREKWSEEPLVKLKDHLYHAWGRSM